MIEHKWHHNELANDLASHLRGSGDRIVWTDMQLGPAGSPRPDVYTVNKSYSKFTPLAYECKISVSDFRRDVTSGKWQSYLKFAAGVIFAVPAGLVKKEDIPPGCGLIVRHETVWRAVKGPTLKHIQTLPHDAWMKLMIDGLTRCQPREPQPRSSAAWHAEKAVRQKWGDTLARCVRDLANAEMYLQMEVEKTKRSTAELRAAEEQRLQQARKEAERDLQHITSAKAELAVALGLDAGANVWQITDAAHKAATRLSSDGEIQRLQRIMSRVQRELAEAADQLPGLQQRAAITDASSQIARAA